LLDIRAEVLRGAGQPEGDHHRQGRPRLREVRHRGPQQIEALLAPRSSLDLHVRVAKDWQGTQTSCGS